MSIITISKGSYYYGTEVAETLAESVGYECVSREILLQASDQFKIPEMRLVRAIADPPSIFERLSLEKEKFVSYVRAAFLKRAQKGNIIYHGFAGHFFLRDVPGILKVRVIADMELRIREVMEREGISARKAKSSIDKIDSGRRKWSRYLYGIDTSDPNLYDMVFRIHTMTVEDVVDSMTKVVRLPCFQLSARAIRLLNDLALDAEVRAHLVEKFPTTRHVSAKDGVVTVLIETPMKDKARVTSEMEQVLGGIEGVRNFEIHFRH